MESPLVSIIIPNYNHAKFLRERIDSVLNQNYIHFEVIILDDASTDESLRIIEEYKNFDRVRVFVNENNSGSTFKQWNKGIELAIGEYIWIAESDDISDPNFLKRIIEEFSKNESASLVFSASYTIDNLSSVTGDLGWWVEGLHSINWSDAGLYSGQLFVSKAHGVRNVIMNASAAVFKKSYYRNSIASENEKYKLCGDWYTWIRLIENASLVYIPDKLNYYRFHDSTVRNQTKRSVLLFKESYLIRSDVYNRYAIAPYEKKLMLKETYGNLMNIDEGSQKLIKLIKQSPFMIRNGFKFYLAFIQYIFKKFLHE